MRGLTALLAIIALSRASVVQQSISFGISPYPPSFDNNPILFGWALFSRMLIVLLCSATLVRVVSRTRAQGVPANHPVVYQRVTWCSFMLASGIGALSDTLTYLLWGEVTPAGMQVVLTISRFCDAMTMMPFLVGLFVPFVINYLIRINILHAAKSMTLNGVVHDMKSTWENADTPIRLVVFCAAATAGVTIAKYWLWLGHGRT